MDSTAFLLSVSYVLSPGTFKIIVVQERAQIMFEGVLSYRQFRLEFRVLNLSLEYSRSGASLCTGEQNNRTFINVTSPH